jgi:hypothetical protein
MEIFRARGDWTDEYNRHLIYELESGIYRTLNLAMVVKKETAFF